MSRSPMEDMMDDTVVLDPLLTINAQVTGQGRVALEQMEAEALDIVRRDRAHGQRCEGCDANLQLDAPLAGRRLVAGCMAFGDFLCPACYHRACITRPEEVQDVREHGLYD